jgi:hypothetical protein
LIYKLLNIKAIELFRATFVAVRFFMLKIREVRTASANVAVQVIYYSNIKRNEVKNFTVVEDAAMISAENISAKNKKVKFVKSNEEQLVYFYQN